MSADTTDVFTELERRHKAIATTVAGLLIATVLLAIVAFFGKQYFRQQDNSSLEWTVKVVVGLLAIGSIVWRRTKLSAMHLKDVAAVQGGIGLIRSMERTTLQLSVAAALMAAVGFSATVISGNEFYSYWASAVALLILIFGYPTKSAWMRAVQRFS